MAVTAAGSPLPATSQVGGQEEFSTVQGELAAVAESTAQANQRLSKLEQDFSAAKKASESASLVAGWTGSHPYIRSKDGNFEMEFGGRLQFDWRSYTGTATPPSSFFIRRARLEAGGQLFKHYEYRVQADFADTGSTLLRDGFININYLQAAQLQFGQFKAPFSQEELQSSKYIDFVERSSVNGLTPGRTPGLMFHGQVLDGLLEYSAGAFNGRRELTANNSSTPEGYVRLRLTPFKGLSFGGALADGRHNNDNSFRGRTASQSVVFFKPVPVNGEIVRANGEFWWRYKNFSVRGEYDQTHQARQGLGLGGGNLPGVIGKGYVLQATYLLTGEAKGESGITPKKTFLETPRGLGAWELAFRYENLQMHDSENPNRAEAFTFGVNWWLSKFVRYQSNFALERFKDPQRAPTPGDSDHFGYLSRIQVIF
ncbi:MAG: hypothetical protein HYS61_01025 [Acidobacteria bacterium]|nr:hypothetical protein [Acidobacteriota bacterium]